MKALFIGSDPALFDAESAAYARLVEYANAIGTLHIVMRANTPDSIRTEGNLTVHGVHAHKLKGLPRVASYARNLISAEHIEVISAQDPFEHGWVAMMAARGTNAKLHIQIHTDFLSPWFIRAPDSHRFGPNISLKNFIRRGLARIVLPKADGIRVVSKRIKQSMNIRYGSRIVEPTILPIAVESVEPSPAPLPRHSFPFALLTVGRLEPEKRIADIIDALALIKDLYPSLGLIVVGEGRERTKLMTQVMEKNLTGRVVFAGARADAWGMMRSAQGYIQASAYEGYGRTLIEAALAQLPIISTDVGILGDVLTAHEDALVSSPGDITLLASHMGTLCEEQGTRERMVQSARQRALEHTARYARLPELIAADLARLTHTPL